MKTSFFALVLLFSSFFSMANATVIGDPNAATGDSCYPFGCANNVGHYQQSYSADKFTGSMNIGGVTFFGANFPYWENGKHISEGIFTITMGEAKAFGKPMKNNLGKDQVVVFQGLLPALDSFGNLTIMFDAGYSYNPVNANPGWSTRDLMLDVTWKGARSKERAVTFLTDGSSISQLNFSSPFTGYRGLITQFHEFVVPSAELPAGEVPEPASLALLGLGVIGLTAARRRQSK